ncbi:ABC transporter ATP-binding protein [Candidatus Latescibacterota bacterium]
MDTTLIKIEYYSFSIDNNTILRDISLEVNEGEYLSIIGPNGAGKTTLLKCLMRIYTGGKGSITLAGKSLNSYKQKELAMLLSYVPQSDGRRLDFTVYEFVMMGRYPYLNPFTSVKKEDKTAVSEALASTETEHLSDRHLDTLSGGERQNVFIAAAIAQGSRILLLDEPTTFLDPKHQTDIHKTLKRVNRERGITIVSVTHDINSAALLSNRVIILKEGAVAFSGSSSEIMCNEVLEGIYDKKFLFVKHPSTCQPVIIPGDIDI